MLNRTKCMIFFLCCALNSGFVCADELRKVGEEYFRNPVRQYSPNDPWTRSQLFRWHTGHAGRFYNCDNEECKRNSPYICWKNSHDSKIKRRGFWNCLCCELEEVKQRVRDGAGACYGACQANCTCSGCANRQVAEQRLVHESIDFAGDATRDGGTFIVSNRSRVPTTVKSRLPQRSADHHRFLQENRVRIGDAFLVREGSANVTGNTQVQVLNRNQFQGSNQKTKLIMNKDRMAKAATVLPRTKVRKKGLAFEVVEMPLPAQQTKKVK